MSENTTQEIDVKKKAATYGVLLGIVSFILALFSLYLTKGGDGLFTTSIISFVVNYGVFLALASYFVILLRKSIGGYWDFSTALKNIFVMLAIAAIIGTLTMSVYNAYFPALQEEALDNTRNMTIETLEAAGAPDDQIDNVLAALDQQREMLGHLSIGQVIKGIAISLILYFILALIFAAIFKKDRPMFINEEGPKAHPWQDNGPSAGLQ